MTPPQAFDASTPSQSPPLHALARERWLPSLRHVLLLVSLIALLLPLGSLHLLKLYESALVRQTESELGSQAAMMAAAYQNELGRALAASGRKTPYGRPLPLAKVLDNDYYQPLTPVLDLARDRVWPPRPEGRAAPLADPLARQAGGRLSPILKDAQRMTLSGMKLLDANGVVVGGQQELGLSFAALPEVRQALQGEPKSLLRYRQVSKQPPLRSISRGAALNVYVAVPVVLGQRVVGVAWVNRTPLDLTKTLYGKRREIIQATLLVLAVLLGMVALTSHTITRPIHALIRQARQVADAPGAVQGPLRHPMTREIALLSQSLTRMAQSLQARSDYIRQFALHVSHEFKTPLTAIQGGIELLQEHGDAMPAAQQARFLANIAQDADRLRRLVNRLLELARADTLQASEEKTAWRPLLDVLASRYAERGLALAIDSPPAGLADAAPWLKISGEALEAALVNLLDNSAQHGATAVQVTVTREGGALVLTLADNGAGISPANAVRLFDPFFTTRREKGGTGLGLSITHALLQAYGASLAYCAPAPNAPGQAGAVFTVRIRIA